MRLSIAAQPRISVIKKFPQRLFRVAYFTSSTPRPWLLRAHDGTGGAPLTRLHRHHRNKFGQTDSKWRCSTRAPPGFFFNDTATIEIYTLSLHDALPILLAKHFGV